MKVQRRFFYFFTVLFLLTNLYCTAQEICNNGKDDDGDGYADLRDPDCQCHYTVTGNLLQNGSFELFDHCPTAYLLEQDSKIANGWIYGTYTNRNEAYYYHNLSCPYDSQQVTTFTPQLPSPDRNAFISIRQYVYKNSNYQETDIAKTYISQCLQNGLKPGVSYTLSFSAGRFRSNDDYDFKYKEEPFTVAVFGNADCSAAPFGQPNVNSNGCPANYKGWTLLGKATVHSKGSWTQGKISFTVPHDINVIEIGPDCSIINPSTELADSTTLLDFYMYYLDDVHLLPTQEFPFSYIQSSSNDPCNDSIIKAPVVPGATYQWYKDSLAIAGATENTYRLASNFEKGVYNVRMMQPSGCAVSEPYIVQPYGLGQLRLPADTVLCRGDSLQLAPLVDGVSYSWNGNKNTKVQVAKAGIYTITASAGACKRMFTTNVRGLNCATGEIYIPNAFTPNDDGRNDVFSVPQETGLQIKTFSIFDRWGNNVFNAAGNKSWDGKYHGKNCPVGVYVYYIKGTLNNKERILKGVVYLIR